MPVGRTHPVEIEHLDERVEDLDVFGSTEVVPEDSLVKLRGRLEQACDCLRSLRSRRTRQQTVLLEERESELGLGVEPSGTGEENALASLGL